MNKQAFTLLEIIIVIIIIGVLAGLALPRLMKSVEYARSAEALAMFASIRSGLERCKLMNNNSYSSCEAGGHPSDGIPDIGNWSALGMEDPAKIPNSHFEYSVRTSSEQYRLYAFRNTLDGGDGTSYIAAEQGCLVGTGRCYYDVIGRGVFLPIGEFLDTTLPP
jgi:prepilin-type N-terminal cleavage/methylation domain-containing protein